MRHTILLALLLLGVPAYAQPETSLTPEFAGLNAKERARLAKREQEEASQDARFQDLMSQAEARFRDQRFEEALATYQEARALRPLNVYPKVKIQDLQALIAKRKAEQEQAHSEGARPAVRVEGPPLGELDKERQAEPPPSDKGLPPSQAESAPVAPKAKTNPSPQPQERAWPPTPSAPLPDGIQERSFLEGRAVVQERSITRSGLTTVYRRVTHPWGQVVHFRDGSPISEREWADASSMP